jgi:putative transposase
MPADRAKPVIFALIYVALRRVLKLIVLICRGDEAKELEILVLRHQVAVLRRQVSRPELGPADRALLAAFSRVLPRNRWRAFVVRLEMLLRWHRRLVARRWSYRSGPGQPRKCKETRELIIRLASENRPGVTGVSPASCTASV